MFWKRFFSILLVMAMVITVPFTMAHAADVVSVSLPDFPVTLNGQTTSNDYSQYPLLVYRNITYFPMTYYDCRLLGLHTEWAEAEGLSIEKQDGSISEYVREIQSSRNSRSQRAQIATGKIQVNGKVIDNSQEEYPLLLFRDVTYFPLTWRFAVDEFGWEYEYDQTTGLTISNPSAPFETTEEWDGKLDLYGGLMGDGGLEIACFFDAGTIDNRPYAGMECYNITGHDIRILPNFCWEYRLYKMIGSRDELVYRKAVPFYYGDLPKSSYLGWNVNETYWNGNFSAGDYRADLIHPEEYRYQIIDSGEMVSTPTESVPRVTFSKTFTIK